MAPCMFYIRHGECSKQRDANHAGICQTCAKYQPRKGYKTPVNKKKEAKRNGWS